MTVTNDTSLFSLSSHLSPTIKGQSAGSSNRITLLEKIAELGSISQAAKAVPMSYKAAWDAINAMNNLSSEPLVIRHTGGKGGGTSKLTEFGRQFITQYRQLEALHDEVMHKLTQNSGASNASLSLWKRLNMEFSAGNQLFGTVTEVTTGAVNNEVKMQLPSGLTLTGIITQEGANEMGLKKGVEVFALIHSSSILISEPLDGVQISARNQIPAVIDQVHQGSVNTEVTCTIDDKTTLSVIVTRSSAKQMQLTKGKAVVLLIKAPSIIFGQLK